jgi:hypothetical protein
MFSLSLPVRYGLVAAVTATVCVALAMARPIPQDQAYHLFADQRSLFGIVNFADVLSNAAFLLVGVTGLWATNRAYRNGGLGSVFEFAAFVLFFAFVVAVSAGSAYYHLQPDDHRLLWDRLPIALAFMTLFALILSDRLDLGADSRGVVMAGLLVTAVLSLVYWRASGDLRLYIGVQLVPIAVLPVLCLLFPRSTHVDNRTVWWMLALYIIGKVLELYDRDIYAVTAGAFGGHAGKHLLAAVAVFMVAKRLLDLASQQRDEAMVSGGSPVSQTEG